MLILKAALIIFIAMELSNVIIMYFNPDFKYGNSMSTFKQWHKSQQSEPERLFVKYMVNWVANCKLIFLTLLTAVLLFGNETITVWAVIATIFSISIYFISLHPTIKKLDAINQIWPKGYSGTLANTIRIFIAMFALALILYYVL